MPIFVLVVFAVSYTEKSECVGRVLCERGISPEPKRTQLEASLKLVRSLIEYKNFVAAW